MACNRTARDHRDTTEYEVKASAVAGHPPRVEAADPGRVRGDLAPRQGPAPTTRTTSSITRMGRTFRGWSRRTCPPVTLPDHVDEVAYGMVVADGMGGMAAGEKASQLAIRTGVELVLNSPDVGHHESTRKRPASSSSRMRDYFRQVDSAVIGEARADRHLSGMGTTLTMAYIIGTRRLHRPCRRLAGLPLPQGEARAAHPGPHRWPRTSPTSARSSPRTSTATAKRHVLTNFVGGPHPASSPRSHRPARGRRLPPALLRRPDRDGRGRRRSPGPRPGLRPPTPPPRP